MAGKERDKASCTRPYDSPMSRLFGLIVVLPLTNAAFRPILDDIPKSAAESCSAVFKESCLYE